MARTALWGLGVVLEFQWAELVGYGEPTWTCRLLGFGHI